MKAEEFASHIMSLAHTVEELEERGLDHHEAIEYRKRFLCPRRSPPLSHESTNEIVALMNTFDTSRLDIGMIRFFDRPSSYGNCLHVADCEADPVLILPSGQVVVRELGAPEHTLWPAADTPNKLLDALVVFWEFRRAHSYEDDDYDEVAAVAAKRCATAAGGDEYLDFYLMLLGVQ